jgi:hypothetical protein
MSILWFSCTAVSTHCFWNHLLWTPTVFRPVLLLRLWKKKMTDCNTYWYCVKTVCTAYNVTENQYLNEEINYSRSPSERGARKLNICLPTLELREKFNPPRFYTAVWLFTGRVHLTELGCRTAFQTPHTCYKAICPELHTLSLTSTLQNPAHRCHRQDIYIVYTQKYHSWTNIWCDSSRKSPHGRKEGRLICEALRQALSKFYEAGRLRQNSLRQLTTWKFSVKVKNESVRAQLYVHFIRLLFYKSCALKILTLIVNILKNSAIHLNLARVSQSLESIYKINS